MQRNLMDDISMIHLRALRIDIINYNDHCIISINSMHT